MYVHSTPLDLVSLMMSLMSGLSHRTEEMSSVFPAGLGAKFLGGPVGSDFTEYL
jgi:hypothetical protein